MHDIRAKQAAEAVCLLGVERLPLGLQDRLLLDGTFTIRSVCQHYSAEKRQEAVSPGFVATFTKTHPNPTITGTSTINVIQRGNPGTWRRYDPSLDPLVVLYYSIID
jgi:hypothetical protein